MLDFNGEGVFARLWKVENDEFGKIINDFLVEGEEVVGAYKSAHHGVVFTNKRIIAISIRGLTGKKKDYTFMPYSRISTYSVETASLFDPDAELQIYMSGVGKVAFQFTGKTDIKEICNAISRYVMG